MAARADLSVPAGQDQENNAVKHPETVYWGLLCIFKQYVYFDFHLLTTSVNAKYYY